MSTMKSDTVLAILAGFGLGLIVAFGSVNFPSLVKNGIHFSLPAFSLPKLSLGNTQTNKTPSPTPLSFQNFTISEPDSESLTNNKSVVLKGKAPANTLVLVNTNTDDFAVSANKDGAFTQELQVHEGMNEIFLTSFADANSQESKKLVIYYSPEKL